MYNNSLRPHPYDRTEIRIFPLYRSEDNHIYVLGGRDGITIPATSRMHPTHSVEKQMEALGIQKDDIDAIHSSSWTYNDNNDRLTLDYTVIVNKTPDMLGEKVPENFSRLSNAPTESEVALLHALRHMSFLDKHDEAIRKVLQGGWKKILSEYSPAVFIGRSATDDAVAAPLNNILVETLPFTLKDGVVEMAVGKDGTFKDRLPTKCSPEQFVQDTAAEMGKVLRVQPTSWREDERGNLILTFAALLGSEPFLGPEDKTIPITPGTVLQTAAKTVIPSISDEELGSHALQSIAENGKNGLPFSWKTALTPFVQEVQQQSAETQMRGRY